MLKLKNQFKIIHLCLIIFIGILFIFNNNSIIAMNNNPSSSNPNNENINNIEEFQNLMLSQRN
ncbi:MAG: SVM family protein [Lettuce witches'-broom phytoplasma]